MKFCVAGTFWVKRHLDVVLKVLQVVGESFFYKTCRYLFNRKTHWKNDCFINEGEKKIKNIEISKFENFGNLKRTSRSFKVSNWDILEFRSQEFEIRSFSFLNSLYYGTLNPKKQNYQIR